MKLHKDVEKVTLSNGDTIYVRKGKLGKYLVYPPKKEDGSTNWRNLLIGDPYMLLNYIIFAIVIMGIWYSGTYELKDKCEATINQLIDDSCDICEAQSLGNGYMFNWNITLNNNSMENNKNAR